MTSRIKCACAACAIAYSASHAGASGNEHLFVVSGWTLPNFVVLTPEDDPPAVSSTVDTVAHIRCFDPAWGVLKATSGIVRWTYLGFADLTYDEPSKFGAWPVGFLGLTDASEHQHGDFLSTSNSQIATYGTDTFERGGYVCGNPPVTVPAENSLSLGSVELPGLPPGWQAAATSMFTGTWVVSYTFAPNNPYMDGSSTGGGTGSWNDSGNWPVEVPNGACEIAHFGQSSIPRIVVIEQPVTVGMISIASTGTYTIAGPGTLTLQCDEGANVSIASGSHHISAPVHMASDTGWTMQSGNTLTVSGSLTAGNGIDMTKGGAGTLIVNHVRADGLSVLGGRLKIAPNGGNSGTSRVTNLGIDLSARLDLTDNDLVVDYSNNSPLGAVIRRATIAGDIKSGYNSGAWDGEGIMTSSGNSNQFALGYGEATAIFSTFPATFSGQTVDDTAVLVRFTRYGDINLDGIVNLTDFNKFTNFYGMPGSDLWTEGDFNYDGESNLADYNLLAANYGLSAGPGGPTPEDWAALAAAIPEPALPSVALLGFVSLIRRRRRA